jgi:hypothetical protein
VIIHTTVNFMYKHIIAKLFTLPESQKWFDLVHDHTRKIFKIRRGNLNEICIVCYVQFGFIMSCSEETEISLSFLWHYLTQTACIYQLIEKEKRMGVSHIQKPLWIWVLLSFSVTALCPYSKIFGTRWNSFWYSNKKLVLC